MSTKTTFKRIALVAVAALGLGVLSVAPSSAVPTGISISGVTAGSAGNSSESGTWVYTDSTTAAKFTISGLLQAADSITASVVTKSVPTGGTTDARFINFDSSTPTVVAGTYAVYNAATGTNTFAVAAGTNVRETATVFNLGATTNVNLNHTFGLQLESATGSRVAGTYTFTVLLSILNGIAGTTTTLAQDVNIVVAKTTAATNTANTTVAPAKSTAFLNATTGTSATADAVVTAVSTADNSVVATIPVRTYNSASVATVESITATVTGPGLVCLSSTCGKSLTVAGTGTTDLTVRADGNAGIATIAVSTPTVTFTPKTVTFYTKAAKTITAKVNYPVLVVGANSKAISATAVDANGTAWTGAMYIYASTAADALIGGSATPVACSYDSSKLVHYCPVTTIASGSASFKLIDASTVALATATSDAVTVKVSAATASTVKIAFDKATYGPYEKAYITVTPLDSTGSTLGGQTFSNLLATGGISATQAFTGSSDTLTSVIVITSADASSSAPRTAGALTYTVYMPAQGTVTISATGGTSLAAAGQVAVSASAAIVNSSVDAATDAANEATDAANAATDAALAAADAADAATAAAQDASDAVAALSATVAKLVASLKAQITSLTNLVIKIQKKVKA
jgi:hypothetical protein